MNPLENYWPGLILGSVIAFAAAVGWVKTGSRAAVVTALVASVLTVAFVLTSLMIETDREAIIREVHEAARDAESNDIEQFLQHVHPDARDLIQRVRNEFPGYQFRSISVKDNFEIAIDGDADPPRARSTFNVVANVRVLSVGSDVISVPRFITLSWEKDGPFWRVTEFSHEEPMQGFKKTRSS